MRGPSDATESHVGATFAVRFEVRDPDGQSPWIDPRCVSCGSSLSAPPGPWFDRNGSPPSDVVIQWSGAFMSDVKRGANEPLPALGSPLADAMIATGRGREVLVSAGENAAEFQRIADQMRRQGHPDLAHDVLSVAKSRLGATSELRRTTKRSKRKLANLYFSGAPDSPTWHWRCNGRSVDRLHACDATPSRRADLFERDVLAAAAGRSERPVRVDVGSGS